MLTLLSKFHVILIPLLLFVLILSPLLSTSTPINIWPMPRFLSWPQHNAIALSRDFTILSPQHQYLSASVTRYLNLIRSENHSPLITHPVKFVKGYTLSSLVVIVTDLSLPLHHGVDESYNLSIPIGNFSAHLLAHSVWGAMRGLETFSQMIWGTSPDLRLPAGISIQDSPLFHHRGVLLDTSRNYYGVGDIMRTIEAMSANKLNVFHWHITDSQSFPLVLPSEPSLAAKGSHGPDMVYTPEDVSKIVQFGFEHGVRVLPEIDTPGESMLDLLFAQELSLVLMDTVKLHRPYRIMGRSLPGNCDMCQHVLVAC